MLLRTARVRRWHGEIFDVFYGGKEVILDKIRNIANVGVVAPGFLRPIDTNRIAREVELEKRCSENGSRNLPPTTAKGLDAVEQDIVQRLQAEWAWQGEELLTQLRAYAHRLNQCSVDAEFVKLQVKARNTLAQLRTAYIAAPRELGPLREKYLAYHRDLNTFRAKHGIKREVRVSGHRFTTFGLLVLLVSFESLLNGAFFADAAPRGLIGGIGIAIGISILNVLLAFSIGLGPARWLHHSNWLVKVIGAFTLIFGALTLFCLHGFALHLREASSTLLLSNPLFTPREAMELAIQTILNAPLAIHDLNSFYLFALGVVFAFAALLKGYRLDDPYPGYGAHYRRAEAAREAYSQAHSELFDNLQEAKDETVEAIQVGCERIRRLPQEANNIRSSRKTLLEKFAAYETEVETSINQLLQRYRDCNRKSRSDAAPDYFDEPWRLPYRFVKSPRVIELVTDADLPQRTPSEALTELNKLADRVLNEYEELLRAYPHPTQMTSDG